MNKYYDIFKKNFPFIVREEKTALDIINNKDNKYIDIYNDDKDLIATSIINKDTILLLCVDKEYRRQGFGTKLLKESETYIKDSGYKKVKVGVGFDYLMPGIPMSSKPYKENLQKDNIYESVSDEAYLFFKKRGYEHSWKDANCFDMRVDLETMQFPNYSLNDTIDGILYRFGTKDDIPNIKKCTDDAEQEFTKYYLDERLYEKKYNQKVLIALKDNIVVGTLIVSIETEGKGLGSVGCTTVCHKYRGRHIGVNMVIIGTKYLKDLGLKKGFLGYTYSGLDKMYGYAGYKICLYYAMDEKVLNN